jgi:hypothetical protein
MIAYVAYYTEKSKNFNVLLFFVLFFCFERCWILEYKNLFSRDAVGGELAYWDDFTAWAQPAQRQTGWDGSINLEPVNPQNLFLFNSGLNFH